MLATLLLLSHAVPGEGASLAGRVVGPSGEPVLARVGLAECPASYANSDLSLAFGSTGPEGRVRLTVAAEWFDVRTHSEFVGLIAWSPQLGIVAERMRLSDLGYHPEFELRCPAPRTSRFRVECGGVAVRGAAAWVAAVEHDRGEIVRIPEGFWRGAEARSDEEGWVELPEQAARIAAIGIQLPESAAFLLHRHWSSSSPPPEVLSIPRIVTGEVLVDLPLPAGSKLTSEFELKRADEQGGAWVTRHRESLDASGAGPFVVSVVASASSVTAESDDASALALGEPKPERAGQSLRISRGVRLRVHGRVVDASSGAPLGGVRIVVRARHRGVVSSSVDGSFEFESGSPKFTLLSLDAPPGHADLSFESADFDAGNREAFDLGELALPRAEDLPGEVEARDGGPMPGAWLTAEQCVRVGLLRATSRLAVISDEEGRYVLRQLAAGTQVQILASSSGRLGKAIGSLAEPPELRIDDTLQARARILGPDGEPVAGFELELWRAHDRVHPSSAELVSFGAESTFTTDERGEITSPIGLDPEAVYALRWSSPEFAGQRSVWFTGDELARGVEIAVTRLQSVRGRLIDTAGEPIVGATVRTRDGGSRTVTDERGEYVLESVNPGGEFLVVVAADGARYAQWGTPGVPPVDWRIDSTGRSEAPPAPAEPPDRERELEIADELLAASFAEAEASGDDSRVRFALAAWSRVDLAGALARLDATRFQSELSRDAARLDIVAWLSAVSPSEALALLQGAGSSGRRTEWRIKTAQLLGGSGEEEQLALARAESRTISAPEQRIHALTTLVPSLLDAGELPAARELLAEVRELVAQLPTGARTGVSRVRYVMTLARLDPAEACREARAIEEPQVRSLAVCCLARTIAASQPAMAQELLDAESNTRDLNSPMLHAPSVVFEMSRVDLARARAIAARHDPTGASDGWIAFALAHEDPVEAKRSLAKAFERARKIEHKALVGNVVRSPLKTAACLLTIAEEVDPDGIRRYLQEVLAMAPVERSHAFGTGSLAASCDAVIAFQLSRWDRSLARKLLEPHVDDLRRGAPTAALYAEPEFWAAFAVVDVDWAAELAREFGSEARRVIGIVLALPPEQRAAYVQRQFVQMFVPGERGQ